MVCIEDFLMLEEIWHPTGDQAGGEAKLRDAGEQWKGMAEDLERENSSLLAWWGGIYRPQINARDALTVEAEQEFANHLTQLSQFTGQESKEKEIKTQGKANTDGFITQSLHVVKLQSYVLYLWPFKLDENYFKDSVVCPPALFN